MSLKLFEESKICKLPSIVRAAGRGDSIILAMSQVSLISPCFTDSVGADRAFRYLQMLESPERSVKSIEHIMQDVVRNVSTPKCVRSDPPSSSISNTTPQGLSPENQVDPVNPVAQMFMFDDTDRILQAIETSQNAGEGNSWVPARHDSTVPINYDQDMLTMMLNWHAGS
jgi:hypothetical protein